MNKPYSIDFTTNTITVTKKFLEQASMMGSEAFNIMLQLRQMNMTIITKAPAKRKNAQLTYSKMEKFISKATAMLLSKASRIASLSSMVIRPIASASERLILSIAASESEQETGQWLCSLFMFIGQAFQSNQINP